jgi:predicted MFS family arabinose efflux permease
MATWSSWSLLSATANRELAVPAFVATTGLEVATGLVVAGVMLAVLASASASEPVADAQAGIAHGGWIDPRLQRLCLPRLARCGGASREQRRRRMMATALDHRYWRLWAATALSNLGDGVRAAAFPLLGVALTRNPVLVAGLVAAQYLPWLAFGLTAGALVDRTDRRTLMWTVNTGRTLLLAAFTVLVATDQATLPLLYAAAFLLGVGDTLYDNAAQAAVPALVAPEQLERANSHLVAAEIAGNELAGPALGAWLFGVAAVLPLATNTGALAVAVLLVASITGMFLPVTPAGPRASLGQEIREGLRWLWGQRLLRAMTGIGMVLAFADVAAFSLLVLYNQEILRLGPAGFGLLLAAGAVGGILGGLAAPALARRLAATGALLLAVGLTGAGHLILGLTGHPLLAGAMLALSSSAFGVWNVVSVSLRQRLAPDRLLGRVSSAYRSLGVGAVPLGALLGGAAAAATSLRGTYVIAGALLFVMAAVGRCRTAGTDRS